MKPIRDAVMWVVVWDIDDHPKQHICREDCIPQMFRTRAEARAYAQYRYGYILRRPDLRKAPFNWRMPKIMKARLSAISR